MQFLTSRWALVVWSGVLVVSFQNCSKIGHNGLIFKGESLTQTSETIIPAEQQLEDIDGQSTSSGGEVGQADPGKNPESEATHDPAVPEAPVVGGQASDGKSCKKEYPVVTDSDITAAVAACRESDQTVGFSASQQIRVVHEEFDSLVDNLSSLSAIHSQMILRASSETSAVAQAKLVQSDLVLCGFSKIGTIRSTHGRIFVVGGTVHDADLVQSSMILINAELKNHHGVKSIIKRYSLK